MENLLNVKEGQQLAKVFILILLSLFLFACASSAVQRTTASNVDMGIKNAQNLVENAKNSDISDTYQNSSQSMKGAVLGGVAGAGVGALATPIGVVPGAAVGALMGASYGRYIDSSTNTYDRLENRGVSTVVLGDQVLIVIPSARIFEPMTAVIKPTAYTTLNMVVRYINKYTKMLVKVTGYTSTSGSPLIDLALSKQQAESVVKYLEAAGVNARLIYAEGCGGTRLVVPATIDWDGSDNYRIEITFEKLYV